MPRLPEESAGPALLPGQADIAQLESRHGTLPAEDLLALAVRTLFPGRFAVVTSFGAESVVLLHMAARIDPAVPVLFVDTRRLFPETLAYRDTLVQALGLTDVRTLAPTTGEEDAFDPLGALFATDPDACCAFRKVAPLEAALAPFSAWASGRKRYQAGTRAALPAFELEAGRIKVNPLAGWTAADILSYLARHDLPRHPLVAKGYPSIGCTPCTTPVAEGEDARAGRWRGQGKTECGIHRAAASTLIGGA
jgi:phosphoadenosine phosphosulfate reductase